MSGRSCQCFVDRRGRIFLVRPTAQWRRRVLGTESSRTTRVRARWERRDRGRWWRLADSGAWSSRSDWTGSLRNCPAAREVMLLVSQGQKPLLSPVGTSMLARSDLIFT